MKAKFVNNTHRTITLADGVTLGAKSSEVISVEENGRIRQLAKMGLISILPPTSSKTRAVTSNNAPAAEATQAKRDQVSEAIRAARAAKDAKAGKSNAQSSSKVTKVTTKNQK